jgi:hypothetical protein
MYRPRNADQRRIGVLEAEFQNLLNELWVESYENLQQRVTGHNTTIAELTWNLAGLDAHDRETAGIQAEMVNAFRSFISVVGRATTAGVGILRTIDPEFPENPPLNEFAARLEAINANIEERVAHMDNVTFAAIEQAVRASNLQDYTREFNRFQRARNTFTQRVPNHGREEIERRLSEARAAAETDRNHLARLQPLHNQLEQANGRWRRSTGISIAMDTAAGAAAWILGGLALSSALSGSPAPQSQHAPLVPPTSATAPAPGYQAPAMPAGLTINNSITVTGGTNSMTVQTPAQNLQPSTVANHRISVNKWKTNSIVNTGKSCTINGVKYAFDLNRDPSTQHMKWTIKYSIDNGTNWSTTSVNVPQNGSQDVSIAWTPDKLSVSDVNGVVSYSVWWQANTFGPATK